MAPERTITAEVLLAGIPVREIADEKEVDAELKGLGARWRPEIWLDTVRSSIEGMESDDHTRIPAMSHSGIGSTLHPLRSVLTPRAKTAMVVGFQTSGNLHGSVCPIVMGPEESGH
jgi:hypothetical protein